MKGLITVLAVLVVFALAFFLYRTPTAPPEMAAAEKAQIQAEIVDVATGINRGFRALDAEAVAEVFHPTESGFAWGGKIYNGTDIVEPLAARLANRVLDDREWVDTRVKVFTRDLAMFQGIADVTIEETDGDVLHYPGNLIFTLLFERTADGWKSTSGAITSGPYETADQG